MLYLFRYTPIDGKWSSPEIQNPSVCKDFLSSKTPYHHSTSLSEALSLAFVIQKKKKNDLTTKKLDGLIRLRPFSVSFGLSFWRSDWTRKHLSSLWSMLRGIFYGFFNIKKKKYYTKWKGRGKSNFLKFDLELHHIPEKKMIFILTISL